jgi:hypothetical protein
MTLQDIERDICRRLDKNPTNLDPETKARLDTFINDRYRELMRLDGINLRDEILTTWCDPHNPRLVLPEVTGSIVTLRDVTSGRVLTQRTLPWIRAQDPSASMTGTPSVYAVLNEAGIQNQPTNITIPNNTELVSNLASDQSDIFLELAGLGGGFSQATVTLNGTTPVVVQGWVERAFRMIRGTAQIYAAVTWRQIDPSLALAYLPQSTDPSGIHQWTLYLFPTPSGRFDYEIDCTRPWTPLAHDLDQPALPVDFHTVLVWGGCAEECLKMDDNRRDVYENKYQNDIRRLRAYLHHSRGERWIPGQSRRGSSDLPGNYPAG